MRVSSNTQNDIEQYNIRLYSEENSWVAYEYSAFLLSFLLPATPVFKDQEKGTVAMRVELDSLIHNHLVTYIYLVDESICDLTIPTFPLGITFSTWKGRMLKN